MQKTITNPDGSISIIEVVTNPNGTQTETVVSTKQNRAGKIVSTTPVTSSEVTGQIPPFVVTDKTQKSYQFTNANGKVVRTMYVNPTQTVEYYPNRLVTNLVVTDKSPLVSLVDITSKTNKAGKSVAFINFDSNVLAKSIIYYSTAPVSLTLGVPQSVVTPSDSLKVVNENFAINHSVEIQGLNAATMYHYVIVTTDESGNQNVTLSDQFTTRGLLNY